MRVLFFCDPHANQRALAHKLAEQIGIDSIVIVRAEGKAKPSPFGRRAKNAALRLLRFGVGLPLRRAWRGMLAHYEARYPDFPQLHRIEVADINQAAVIKLVEERRPDLVLVSGTNLLKQPLISKIQETGKVMNLHTGISPYVKGAPNCTNWCLALRRFDLIGNTIMWLDAGIDSGNLVATKRTELDGSESLMQLHVAVMEHAHQLYVRCARLSVQGSDLPSVPQASIAEGSLFLNKDWTPKQVLKAVTNFRLHYWREAKLPPREPIILVDPSTGLGQG